MLPIPSPRAGSALLALLTLLLAACLLAPGKFTSSLDIRKDGRFSFAYTGEIHMLALSKLATEGDEARKTFAPEPCRRDASMEERPCTTAEIAEQRQTWQEERASAADKRRRDAESMKAILGGIDPSNPRAAEELAQRLRRQAGWKRVTYKGDGLFDVDFAITGRLDHDFTFPTIERFPMANAFVQVGLRNDGTVRVDAPGFAPASGGEPYRAMMQGMATKQGEAPFPQVDGHFTLRTDGAILANNTDEGPQPDPAGQKLDWAVNVRTPAAPTALIRLAP
jgi:hypothetical protein